MAPLPLPQAIERFVQNEDRMETFTHGTATSFYVARDGQQVPSLRKFLNDSMAVFEQHAAELTLGIKVEDAVITIGSTSMTVREWISMQRVEPFTPNYWNLGFFGDGQQHRLSEVYPSLAAARGVFPRANSLNEYIDGHAIQRDIDLQAARNDKRAKIVLPACRFWHNGIDATNVNLTLEGAANGGTLALTDFADGVGTAAIRQGGYNGWAEGQSQPLTIINMLFENKNTSNTSALGFMINHNANAGLLSALTFENVIFRSYHKNGLSNVGRGLRFSNVIIIGVDFVLHPNAGIEIFGTPENNYGMFSWIFDRVIVANYRWGWWYRGRKCAIEGQSFYSCAAYNGHGMVAVDCDGLNKDGSVGYDALLWSFDNCDWEGLGYALQMQNCRNVKVSAGFYIFSRPYLTNDRMYKVNGDQFPAGEGRRMFYFLGCTGVSLQDVEMASANMDNSILVETTETCDTCKFEDSVIRCYNTAAVAGFILSGAIANTIIEKNTKFLAWPGGPMVFYVGDGDKYKQISYTDAYYNGGTVTDSGYYTFYRYNVATFNDQAEWPLTLPRRTNGQPFFRFAPVVQVTAENSNNYIQPPSIKGRDTGGITFKSSAAGIIAGLHVNAAGL